MYMYLLLIEGKKARVAELLSNIEERLHALEEEKEDLKAYHELDRTRRSVQYIIHDTELQNIKEKLDQVCNHLYIIYVHVHEY